MFHNAHVFVYMFIHYLLSPGLIKNAVIVISIVKQRMSVHKFFLNGKIIKDVNPERRKPKVT